MKSRWLFILPFLALLCTPALADFDPVGGNGDLRIDDRCTPGAFLVGARLHAGAWIDSIQLFCARMDPTGRVAQRHAVSVQRGGPGGVEGFGFCPPNQIVFGINFWLTINRQVSHIKFFCADRFVKQHEEIDIGQPNVRGDAIRQSCGPEGNNQAATGMTIAFGDHVNALGLMCGDMPAAYKPAAQGGGNDGLVKTAQRVFCADFAEKMVNLLKESQAINCRHIMVRESSLDRQRWFQNCLAGKSGAGTLSETTDSLNRCKNEGAGGNGGGGQQDRGGNVATALAGNKVYKNNSGDDSDANLVCELSDGDTGTVLKTGPEKWVKLSKISGDCNGQGGWVWNDGELRMP